jgi:hypothetical protein
MVTLLRGTAPRRTPEPATDLARPTQRLLHLPEGADVGKAINDAMKAIEAENDELKDVLPKAYGRFEAATLKNLLKLFGTIPDDVEGDVFGRIYGECLHLPFSPTTVFVMPARPRGLCRWRSWPVALMQDAASISIRCRIPVLGSAPTHCPIMPPPRSPAHRTLPRVDRQ